MSKPYSRPSSFAGPSTTQPRGTSPTKPAPSTRALPTSTSNGSLTRSGSEGSLFSTLKSAFSRPIAWLTTPSKSSTSFQTNGGSTSKRDFDPEDPASPSDRHAEKRQRTGTGGDYEPESKSNHIEVQGRAIEGRMLPPLPPSVSLSKNRSTGNAISANTNFSRPLGGGGMTSSKSMPYLDPPAASLGSRGVLSRSSKLSQLTDFEVEEKDVKKKGKEVDRGGLVGDGNWSPWKERYVGSRVSMTPKRNTPSRLAENRDYTLPSLSPFHPPPSPSRSRQPPTPTSALARSNTSGNLRRAGSVVSDVSMGGSQRMRHSSSMMFGNGAGDDRMSVAGDREKRDASATDWFMKDRWTPASPAARAASMRLGSVAPPLGAGGTPIRKGQMVWTADKGFMRESELKASAPPQPVHQNEAERILFSLESLRKTPLTAARTASSSFGESATQSGSSLFGASSRQIRRSINVPLSTAQAGETARQRRDRERREEGGMSTMISPYGRRRQVDDAAKDVRRQRKESEGQREYSHHSESASQAARSQSHAASDHSMKSRESAKAPSPSPQPTPRRSSRLKRVEAPSDDESMATPKKRSTKKATSQVSPSPKAKETPRRTRKRTAEKGTSPEQPPAPTLPTITETAPSPSHTNSNSNSDTYAPLAEGHQRESSSLRAKSGITKRTHIPSAGVSRATSPSTGKFSAREEDLPDMEELEQTKIKLPSFSGITFGNMDAGFGEKKAESTVKPVEAAQPEPVKLSVPTRLGVGPLSRLSSSRPRASSPLAGGSIVAQPDSPDNTPVKAATAPTPVANGNSFFPISSTPAAPTTSAPTLFASLSSAETSKKSTGLGLGLGKPPAQNEVSSEVPSFFGNKSQPTSGTSTPVPAAATFNFGLPSVNAQEMSKVVPSNGNVAAPLFSFNAPKAAEQVKPVDTAKPAFSFASTAPVEAPKPAFSFSGPTQPGEPPKSAAEPAKPAFSFGSSAAPTPASTATKPAFAFGATSAAPVPSQAPVATPSFSFGATATPALSAAKSPEPVSKPAFTFGATSAAPLAKPAEPSAPLGGFNFNKPAELIKPAETSTLFGGGKPAAAPVGNGFAFGGAKGNGDKADGEVAKSGNLFGGSGPSNGSTPSFAFGASQANGSGNGFGTAAPSTTNAGSSTPFGAPAAPSTPFGNPPNPSSTSFAFGAQPNANQFGAAPATSTGFAFGSNNPAPTPTQNGFGTPAAQPAAGGFNFSFNTPSASPAQTPSFAFGQQNPPAPATPTTAGNAGFSFGAPATTTSSFAFGAGGNGGGFVASNNGGGFGGGFGGGQQQQQRAVGSPAPSAGGGDGFSMGATGETPGSPGGRKIKGLRRGTKR